MSASLLDTLGASAEQLTRLRSEKDHYVQTPPRRLPGMFVSPPYRGYQSRAARGSPAGPDERPDRWRARRTLLALIDLAGLVVLGILVFRSPWFTVEAIDLYGTDRVTPAEVARLGSIAGSNLFLLDPVRAADRIRVGTMARRVEVSRWLPNRVAVTIEERTAWAVWRTAAANYLIDEEGVVLGPTSQLPPLPSLFDVEHHVLDPGARVDASAITLAQQLREVLPARIGKRPVRFEYGRYGGVKAILEEGGEVRFGTADDLEYKIATLQAMLADAAAGNRTITYADLRLATRPYYRAAGPPQKSG